MRLPHHQQRSCVSRCRVSCWSQSTRLPLNTRLTTSADCRRYLRNFYGFLCWRTIVGAVFDRTHVRTPGRDPFVVVTVGSVSSKYLLMLLFIILLTSRSPAHVRSVSDRSAYASQYSRYVDARDDWSPPYGVPVFFLSSPKVGCPQFRFVPLT